MKNKIVFILLIISLSINLYIAGKWVLVDQWYERDSEEDIILSEMVQNTVESKDYQKLATKENIMAINADMNKFDGGVFPYYFGVFVRTDKQTYQFACNNENCSEMENVGSGYSIYQDENPRLPFEK